MREALSLDELKNILKDKGVVGCGGAGFPTHIKLDGRADTIILNCAECEPLLHTHKNLLADKAEEILCALNLVMTATNASKGIVAVKKEYKKTIDALFGVIGKYPDMSIKLLKSVYPMGDEVILAYEATGKIIAPGSLPIDSGLIVLNAETLYNVYNAVYKDEAVTHKYLTVTGEVKNPKVIRAQIGDLVSKIAEEHKITTDDPAILIGGVMMGTLADKESVVTKTTNAIIVLPKDHMLARHKPDIALSLRRAASVCCQCRACTDMCPRNLIGYPIEPHLFMRGAYYKDFFDTDIFTNAAFCCGCGICERYACPQSLSPCTIIQSFKAEMFKNNLRPKAEADRVSDMRQYCSLNEDRLMNRLGLSKYDKEVSML